MAARYGGRIRYIRREQDRGPIVCWRDGIENSSGEFVHINYDDDWIDDSFVEKTLPLLRPEVGFVYTRTRIHEPGNLQTKVLLRHPAGIRRVGPVVQFLLRENCRSVPAARCFAGATR